MDPWDLFRGFFGVHSPSSRGGNRFGSPPYGEEDDPQENPLRRPRPPSEDEGGQRGFHMEIFTNPLEMERHFDQQLDRMLRSFGFGAGFGFGVPPGFGSGGLVPPGEEGEDRGPAWRNPFEGWGMLPPPGLPPPGSEHRDQGSSAAGSRDFMLKSGFVEEEGKKKADSDLDEVPPGRIGEILDDNDKQTQTPQNEDERQIRPFTSPFGRGPFEGGPPGPFGGHFRSFGSSVSTRVRTMPDGSVESVTTRKDSEGREETRVTRKGADGRTTETVTTRMPDGTISTRGDDDDEGGGGFGGGSGALLGPRGGGGAQDFGFRERNLTQSLFDKFFGR